MRIFLWTKKILFSIAYFALIICGLYACASVGTPGGGDYDTTPPQFVRSDPEPNTTNFNKNKISVWFDEYIKLTNPSEKVIITPPQLKIPVIKAVGRNISVELKDSLIPNTTYTFDFTDGIIDNNENNALEGFSFAFSTGDVVDTLEISGILLNAENLEPMPKITIGIHSDLSDTAFNTKPFVRISQTNDRGKFSIKNIAPGSYRLFALQDLNRDFKFDNPTEAIAFHDSLIIPSFEPAIRTDTIWKDSLTIDTLLTVPYTRFTPDNIILRLFTEENELQYFVRSERIEPSRFTLEFNSYSMMPPSIQLLNKNNSINDWFILEQSPDQKKMIFWITDSLVAQQDTLHIRMDYMTHDTVKNLVPTTDTLNIFQRGQKNRNRNKENKKEKENEKEKIEFMNILVSPTGTINVYDTVKIEFSEPLAFLDPDKIIIEQKVDTLFNRISLPITQDSLNPRLYYLSPPWPYAQEYSLSIDSAAITSIYGKWNDTFKTGMRIKAEDEYANLYIQVSGIDYSAGFGQLLTRQEKVIKESPVIDGELRFENVPPGKYYLRYINDKNKNGKWDTGIYSAGIQPEEVYYYPDAFELKKYMEWEQSWNITAVPANKQKPLEITKNKPVEKKPKKDRNEEQKNTRSTSNSTGFSGGFPRL